MSTLTRQNIITGHVLVVPAPGHGHWPTLIVFTAILVKHRPQTAITILAVGDFHRKINDALDQHAIDEDARKNIRVVKLGGDGLHFLEHIPVVFENFIPYYTLLESSCDVICKTGKTYGGIKPPDTVIVDFFFYGIIGMVRSISQRRVPIYGWFSINSASILRFGRKEIGGLGDVEVEAPILAKESNKSIEEVSYEMYFPSKGDVVRIPGVPPMYDYEFDIERMPLALAPPIIQLKNTIHRFIRECDGLLTASDTVFEPESNEVLRSWFAETNRSVYVLGPLTPKEPPVAPSVQNEVSRFLDGMYKTRGEHSVCYVSFGTVFAPMGPGLVKLLEVLLDTDIPFIYSAASVGNLPNTLKERIAESNIVLMAPWVPQQRVLNHQATGWFITHGGQNGVTEAISAGVPMIVYPISADQPINAAYISLKFNIGYELLEIRTAEALAPAYRGVHPTGTLQAIENEIRNVLAKAQGPDGEQKRKNIVSLRDKRNALWGEGGKSKEEFEKFIRDNLPETV